MAIFQLYQMPLNGNQNEPDLDVISMRFSWSAFVLGPLWAAYHRLWVVALGWLVAMLALAALSTFIGADAGFWLYIAGMAWLGFSAPEWRARRLEKAGFLHSSTFFARSKEHALARAFRASRRPSGTP